jgi:hypothetical protein
MTNFAYNPISGIFREDTDSINPIPYLHDGSPILYKPSTTPAPEITNEIYQNSQEFQNPQDFQFSQELQNSQETELIENLPQVEYFQQSQDQPVDSLEDQLINLQSHEALKLPHFLKRDETTAICFNFQTFHEYRIFSYSFRP